MTKIPPHVAAIFDAVPKAPRAQLLVLRDIIFEAARTSKTAPLEETLKWGQPSYLPVKPRVGTTIRLGWASKSPKQVSLYVPCQTTLVDSYRERFPDAASYDGNRAIQLRLDAQWNKDALHQIAAMALTYHRLRRGKQT